MPLFFDPFLVLFAFGVGILGAMFGGIQTFICTGFAGIVVYILKAAGVEPTLLGDTVLNTLLLPAIIFNGSAVATAVAAKKYPDQIQGWDITRSLIFLHDTSIMLVGGAAGSVGYLVFSFFSHIGLPADPGATAIIVVGVLTRLLLSNGRKVNPDASAYYREQGLGYWVFQTVNCIATAAVFAFILHEAGPDFYGVGFSISAALLLFGYAGDGQKVPTTHQITSVVGTALAVTGGNIAIAIVFATLANHIYLVFAKYFNEDCSTHIDPPAVGIFVGSLLLNLIF
jgi:hypothetical protein